MKPPRAVVARRSGPLHARHVVKFRHTRELLFDGVMRGAIGSACLGQGNGDVNSIREQHLRLAGLPRRIFGPHADFRAAIAGVARSEHEFACNSPNRGGGGRRGFFLAACRK